MQEPALFNPWSAPLMAAWEMVVDHVPVCSVQAGRSRRRTKTSGPLSKSRTGPGGRRRGHRHPVRPLPSARRRLQDNDPPRGPCPSQCLRSEGTRQDAQPPANRPPSSSSTPARGGISAPEGNQARDRHRSGECQDEEHGANTQHRHHQVPSATVAGGQGIQHMRATASRRRPPRRQPQDEKVRGDLGEIDDVDATIGGERPEDDGVVVRRTRPISDRDDDDRAPQSQEKSEAG